jgi:hypothetical protein
MTETEAQELHMLVGSCIPRLQDACRMADMHALRGLAAEIREVITDLTQAREIVAVLVADAIGDDG